MFAAVAGERYGKGIIDGDFFHLLPGFSIGAPGGLGAEDSLQRRGSLEAQYPAVNGGGFIFPEKSGCNYLGREQGLIEGIGYL